MGNVKLTCSRGDLLGSISVVYTLVGKSKLTHHLRRWPRGLTSHPASEASGEGEEHER